MAAAEKKTQHCAQVLFRIRNGKRVLVQGRKQRLWGFAQDSKFCLRKQGALRSKIITRTISNPKAKLNIGNFSWINDVQILNCLWPSPAWLNRAHSTEIGRKIYVKASRLSTSHYYLALSSLTIFSFVECLQKIIGYYLIMLARQTKKLSRRCNDNFPSKVTSIMLHLYYARSELRSRDSNGRHFFRLAKHFFVSTKRTP